ncbi:hypothetical protein [Actinomycetospora chibensis]|uniref:DUF308 domain-containing protein n=1 Tax=Actinomycetospora chibensis TaxID=663606 RepID=A0ABV9RI26_9PSEU|nr:hypothetical protein [Actinomycetospora chibensis]MDD7925472.1 hypothetical protein [Actinomycetospora chibensis]
MTAPEPDDTRPDPADSGVGDPHRPGVPDDIDAAFASIVADWAASGAPRWPDEVPDPSDGAAQEGLSSGLGTATPPGGQRRPRDTFDADVPRPATRPGATPPRRDPTAQDPTAQDPTEQDPPARDVTRPSPKPAHDEHYVPPEPPPLPRLGVSSLLGLGLLIVGVVLLAVPGLLGGPVGLGIVPGLLAMTAGLGWLVFGLRRGRDTGGDGSDDGAIL